jgi:3',5'-cyclic AMP phosphodiesterase CpdA
MRIVHISDLHITTGSEFKRPTFDAGIQAINKMEPPPELIFISGDITWEGILPEYEMAGELLKGFKFPVMLVPGNHDSRHIGYKLFAEFFGGLEFYKDLDGIGLLGLDSSEPDLDQGHVGRKKYLLIEENLGHSKKLKIMGFHHHLVPVPNAGRDRNILNDGGEVLDLVLSCDVSLVLMGHRHVPFAVRVHNTLMVNTGTFSSSRTRAHFGNSFNIIDIDGSAIMVTSFDIEEQKQTLMVKFDRENEIYMNRYYTL